MKTKFGAIIVAGSGKVGGHVASKNRSGSYLRTKVTPINPQSTAQVNQRGRLTTNAKGWSSLTADQRNDWNSACTNFAGTNVFGDKVNPSGFNLYVKLNNNLATVGVAAITTPPAPAAVPMFSSLSIAADKSDASLILTFAPAINAAQKVIWMATKGLNAGKSFVKSEYRYIGQSPSTDASPLDVGSAYVAKFGTFPAAGKKIFVKAYQITLVSGLMGASVQASTIVVA